MIKAPYNFVPLPDKVVIPDWGPLVSQDVPFSDGVSGTISLTLTPESPIFVRNGHSREDAEAKNTTYASFSNVGGKYFLPGTTVKGAIRSVLEILSFGKMRLDANARFAQREWDNVALYDIKTPKVQKELRCGWLTINGDGSATILDCGRPYRIGQGRIDKYLEKDIFKDELSVHNPYGLKDKRPVGEEEIDPKTAYYKYRLIETYSSLDRLCGLTFSEDVEYTNEYQQRRLVVKEGGDVKGTIVLTGQPDKWKDPRPKRQDPEAGKYYEFVFPEPQKNARNYTLSEEEMNQYLFIYAESPDWKYLKEKKPYGGRGIPVFFRLQNRELKDWGLSFMYKIPYEKSPAAALPEKLQSNDCDMADCIFGYIGKDNSLKGRVQFSHFMSDRVTGDIDGNPSDEIALLLASPKASYYPNYIRQDGSNGIVAGNYKTYNDGVINGWKRYLRRRETYGRLERQDNQNDTESVSDTMITTIRPVSDVVFSGSVRFHNLRPEELGALLSALTFHGNGNECCHQIGMAKPYGYGKVRLEITHIDLTSVGAVENSQLLDSNGYMAVFENYMNKSLNKLWIKSAPVNELITIARFDVSDNENFDYMKLDINGTDDFESAKLNNLYLQRYSALIDSSFSPASLLRTSDEVLKRLSEQREAHKTEKKNRDDEKVRKAKDEDVERAKGKAEDLEKQLQLAKEKEEAEKAARMAERAAGGLAFLEEIYEIGPNTGKYKIKDFKNLRNRLSDYLEKIEKSTVLPENLWTDLGTSLLRLAKSPVSKEKKLWPDRNSSIWKYVETVTSKANADTLFAAANS